MCLSHQPRPLCASRSKKPMRWKLCISSSLSAASRQPLSWWRRASPSGVNHSSQPSPSATARYSSARRRRALAAFGHRGGHAEQTLDQRLPVGLCQPASSDHSIAARFSRQRGCAVFLPKVAAPEGRLSQRESTSVMSSIQQSKGVHGLRPMPA